MPSSSTSTYRQMNPSQQYRNLNYVPYSPDDPRCLACKSNHCFQCEHKPVDTAREREIKQAEYDYYMRQRNQPTQTTFRRNEIQPARSTYATYQQPPKKSGGCCSCWDSS